MKKFLFLMLSISLCFSLTGCFGMKADNNDVTDNNDTSDIDPTASADVIDKKARVKEIEDDAKKDAANEDGVKKEDIQKAVSYIHEHNDDAFKSDEVSEKLIYYGAYLKYVGEKKTDSAKHDLAVLGDNVHGYVSKVYAETEDKTSDAVKNMKDTIDKAVDGMRDTKDKMVDEFYDMVK